ncbi:MAG: poly-beta-1,6 N-acetyl-D-glucosamine synthase [Clostridiales bacterium]|nr:poly-beta-1,6 N-acetyl-D-glucosamine synthase [Clostridiales bacterium]
MFSNLPLRAMEVFVYWYPAIMGMMWILGSLVFYFSNERKGALQLEKTPFVSILMPAHNESKILYPVVKEMVDLNYPEYEVILINDGSSDDTSEVLKDLALKYDRVRVIDLKENCGKANALYLGLIASKGEILVGVDADSYLDKNALRYLVSHFVNKHNGERVGAVTGNPRVRNRGSLLGKLQLCEYASIISLIKRTQRILGKVMTVSGVCVAYRKRALMECGFWDRDMMTEDIAVTWKLEKNFWDVRYEPRALCWMLVPETIKGLWRQRRRWSEGGLEVIFRHWDIFRSWKRRRMTPIYLEQLLSFFWSVCWLILTIILITMEIQGHHVITEYIWKSQFLSFVCLFQFLIAMWLESRYDEKIFDNAWSVIWYPILYWYINVFIALASIFKAILPNKKLATWKSPDRGITQTKKEKTEGPAEEIDTEALEDMIFESKPREVKIGIDAEDRDALMVLMRKEQAITGKAPSDEPVMPLIDGSYENPIVGKDKDKHIEYDTKQVWWKKLIEVILTIVGWVYMLVYWIYMMYGVFRDALGYPVKELFIYDMAMLKTTEHYFYIMGLVIMIELAALILWKEYNRRRFGKKTRRTFKPDIENAEIDACFELQPELSNRLHNHKYVEVLQNPIPEGMGQGRKGKKKKKKKS